MPSTFFGLNIAYTGLLAANAALNTTNNNISNAETNGYSRQYVVQQASEALRTFTTYGCAGAGVDTLSIERLHNDFYDTKYWNNNTDCGEYDAKNYYMSLIEQYYRDDGGKTANGIDGFNTIFNKLYEALAELKKAASMPDTKSQFIAIGGSLTDYFNNLSGNLQKVQKDANSDIKMQVDRINTISAQIASLNKQINVIELTGVTANELRDRRTVLIDELSGIVPVEINETQVTDPNYPDRKTGATNFSIRIAGGQSLVDSYNYRTLQCIPRETGKKLNLSDVEGLVDIKWSDGSEFGMYSKNVGGKLGGLIASRDGNNSTAFGGKVTDIGTAGGKQTVTVEVTDAILKDLNKSNLSGSGTINLGGELYTYDEWSFTEDVNGKCTYTFTLSSNNSNMAQNHLVGGPAKVGTEIDYKGIPYYMSQMNEWIRAFSAEFNKILTQPGAVDSNGDPGSIMFTGNNATSNLQFAFTTSYDKSKVNPPYTVKSTDDSYYRLTALNFAVSRDMDISKLATHTGASDGESKYDVLDQLFDLKTNRNTLSFRGTSADQFLQCMYSDVGVAAQNAKMFSGNFGDIQNTIQNQRLSVSGVDKDEEAMSMVKYQASYTLASKMIQTLTEIYDRLILQTGV